MGYQKPMHSRTEVLAKSVLGLLLWLGKARAQTRYAYQLIGDLIDSNSGYLDLGDIERSGGVELERGMLELYPDGIIFLPHQ